MSEEEFAQLVLQIIGTLLSSMAGAAGPEPTMPTNPTVFDASSPPGITVGQYMVRIAQFARVPPVHFISSLVYID